MIGCLVWSFMLFQFWWGDHDWGYIKSGVFENYILRVVRERSSKWDDTDYWKNNPENMQNIRFWLYAQAKLNDVYIDDKYIIPVLDLEEFYKHRELVLKRLDD